MIYKLVASIVVASIVRAKQILRDCYASAGSKGKAL